MGAVHFQSVSRRWAALDIGCRIDRFVLAEPVSLHPVEALDDAIECYAGGKRFFEVGDISS